MFDKSKKKKANKHQTLIMQDLVSKIVDSTADALRHDAAFRKKIVNIILKNADEKKDK